MGRFEEAMGTLKAVAVDPLEYVRDWKSRTGGKAVGILPMNFPAELVHCTGALPVIVQEATTPITEGDVLLTEFYCAFTRSLADQAATGALDVFDGIMNADHCIQLLGAADIIRSERPTIPLHFGHLETSLSDLWARDRIQRGIDGFSREIERFTGSPVRSESLSHSIALYNQGRQMLRRVFEERRFGNAALSPVDLQILVKTSMVMDPAEHAKLLEAVIEDAPAARQRDDRLRVHLSGHFCHAPKPELLALIEDCGTLVVDDDLYHGARHISTDVRTDLPPLEALGQWYRDRNVSAPCPTRVQHDVDWDAHLLDGVERSGAQAVVVLMAKFCEPHMLYYPELKKALDSRGIPHIVIETEHAGIPAETIRTRIESMTESLHRRHLVNP